MGKGWCSGRAGLGGLDIGASVHIGQGWRRSVHETRWVRKDRTTPLGGVLEGFPIRVRLRGF